MSSIDLNCICGNFSLFIQLTWVVGSEKLNSFSHDFSVFGFCIESQENHEAANIILYNFIKLNQDK